MAKKNPKKITASKAMRIASSLGRAESLVSTRPSDGSETDLPTSFFSNEPLKAPMETNIATNTTATAHERTRKVVLPNEIAASVTKGVNEQHEMFQVKANAELIKQIFEKISQHIAEMDDGVVIIKGLGSFNCRSILREGTGGESPKSIRRVTFGVAESR